jgi:rubrerythrin
MAPRRMIDFLHWAENYHKRLRQFYESHTKEAARPEVRSLLDYMAQHQAILARVIEEYEKDAPRAVLDTWFKVSPDPKAFKDPDAAGFRADMTTGEVIDLALDLDRSLREMYSVLLRSADSVALREMIQNLIDAENREQVRLLRSQIPV